MRMLTFFGYGAFFQQTLTWDYSDITEDPLPLRTSAAVRCCVVLC